MSSFFVDTNAKEEETLASRMAATEETCLFFQEFREREREEEEWRDSSSRPKSLDLFKLSASRVRLPDRFASLSLSLFLRNEEECIVRINVSLFANFLLLFSPPLPRRNSRPPPLFRRFFLFSNFSFNSESVYCSCAHSSSNNWENKLPKLGRKQRPGTKGRRRKQNEKRDTVECTAVQKSGGCQRHASAPSARHRKLIIE